MDKHTEYKLQQKIETANGIDSYISIGSAYNTDQLELLKKKATSYREKNPAIELRLVKKYFEEIEI
ncbi:MAG: hypothetical protein KUG81_09910 [Gammaproteobacteria bacterium]|nr:hypothetical protein [Gammaproteobacteria bacterium]